MNTKKRLLKQCQSIVEELERLWETGFYDEDEDGENYFGDVLGGCYYVGLDGDFQGVRIIAAYGGPNIYIDTKHGTIEGYWGMDHIEIPLPPDISNEIDRYWREWFELSILHR